MSWTVDTLKEHLEALMEDRDIAVKVAFTELQRRLEVLNHAHQDAREKERDFFSRDQHEIFSASIHTEIESLRKELHLLQRPNYQLWIMGGALAITIIGSLWWMATTPYQTEITRLRNDLDEHVKQMDAYNDTLRRITPPSVPVPPRRP